MQDSEDRPSSRSGWMKWALLGSLAANLAFVGLVAGAVWRHDGPGNRMPGDPGPGAFGFAYLRALPPEDRREIFRGLRAADALPQRSARRAQYDTVIALLRADPFDPEALLQAVSQQSEASVRLQGAAQSAWLAVVDGMTSEERVTYAAEVERNLLKRSGDR